MSKFFIKHLEQGLYRGFTGEETDSDLDLTVQGVFVSEDFRASVEIKLNAEEIQDLRDLENKIRIRLFQNIEAVKSAAGKANEEFLGKLK